jgi:hypothetical protein
MANPTNRHHQWRKRLFEKSGSSLSAATARPGASGMTRGGSTTRGVPGAGQAARRCSGQRRMGGHELFQIATATLLAMDRGFFGKNQHFGNMAAIGTQKVK